MNELTTHPLPDDGGTSESKSHGIVSFVTLRDGDLLFVTALGAMYRLHPDSTSASNLERLGWVRPDGSRYAACLICPDGESVVFSRATSQVSIPAGDLGGSDENDRGHRFCRSRDRVTCKTATSSMIKGTHIWSGDSKLTAEKESFWRFESSGDRKNNGGRFRCCKCIRTKTTAYLIGGAQCLQLISIIVVEGCVEITCHRE